MSWVVIGLVALLMAEKLILLRYACDKWRTWSNALARCVKTKVEECKAQKVERKVYCVPLPTLRIGDSNVKMAKLRDADGKLAGSLSETYIYALLHMPPADMRKYNVKVRLIERKGGEE